MTDITSLRKDFPGTERWTYLDTAARGLIPRTVRQQIDRQLDDRMYDGGNKAAMFDTVERARRAFGDLIGAESEEIALTKSVAEGINAIASAFPWRAGDVVLYCPDLEHPSNVYPWLHLERTHRVVLRPVPAEGGRLPVERLVAIMHEEPRTRLVAVSTVTFSPGFRTDLQTLGRACRAGDIFLLADAVQSVGILQTDVRRMSIDALAVSTQKGLLGLYGMGFLYCDRAWAERMTPAYVARFSVDLGEQHEATIGMGSYRLMPAARRFDLGNYNFLGAAAADASLRLLSAIGTSTIERHVCPLACRLASGLLALGLPVCGGAPGAHLGSIVSVGTLAGDHDSTSDDTLNALARHLDANRVKLSTRRGALRFSLHLYNDVTDVDRVLHLAREWRTRS